MRSKLSTILAFGFLVPNVSLGVAQDEPCFSPDDRPVFSVIQQAPPPKTDTNRYKYYPATAFTSMRLDALNSSNTSRGLYYVQWANHGPRRVEKSNVGPHITPGSGTIELFSSIDTADACTMAQTAAVFGDSKTVDEYARGRLKITTAVTQGRFIDTCFVQDERLGSRIAGIWLDYELGDKRSTDHTSQFLERFARYIHEHGKKALLYLDPLNAPSQPNTGIDERNAGSIIQQFDLTGIMLWGSNKEKSIEKSFQDQRLMIKPWNPEKVFITFALNGTSFEDAKTVFELMKVNKISSISLWRNLAQQGGKCDIPVNRKIACLTFGRCS